MALERERLLKDLGAKIEKRRTQLRLTQEQVADRIGVTLRGYTRWERGEAMPYPRNIEGLAQALETTPEALLGEPPPAPSDQLDRIEDAVKAISGQLDEILKAQALLAAQVAADQVVEKPRAGQKRPRRAKAK